MRQLSFYEIITRIIYPALFESFRMLILGFLLSGILGFFLAIILFITRDEGLKPNKKINYLLNILISAIRSFPFVILMVSIIPITRFISGSSIGWKAALVPLTFAGTPFVARMIENNFKEANNALIEAAKSFGASNIQIIFRVIIPQVLPSIVSSFTLAMIQVLSLSAVAGTVGAGGLGAAALTYGYQSFNYKVMYSIVVILFFLVLVIQLLGENLYKKFK